MLLIQCAIIISVGLINGAESYVKMNKVNTEPIVTTKNGQLRGSVGTLFDGAQYYSFKGIPYAQPPVGKLRFKAPIPVTPWKGIRDATQHGPVCIQFDTLINKYIEGSEDCLFLNIYTKLIKPTAKIPVMVYIHGGSFMSGSGNNETYTPELLLQHDVVLVTINYRLEVLGFLSLNNAGVPGNAGMKDQVLALRWIQDNIEQFGGDPNSVTLFGEGSGAASVTYHMISPLSKGLFHKAIVQSGVCLEDWALGRDSVGRAFRLGKLLGKDLNTKAELIQFLREASPLNLTNVTYKTLSHEEKNRGLPEHFVPIVEETFLPDSESFLSESPVNLLLQDKVNKVPLMIGYNSGEGLFLLDHELKKLEINNKDPTSYVPRALVTMLPEEGIQQFGRRIKMFYFNRQQITLNDLEQMRDLLTDMNYAYNTHRFAHLYQSLHEPVYMYRFDFDTELNWMKKYLGHTNEKGASHVDDLFYLFYNSLNRKIIDKNGKLKKIVYKVSSLWTNFAKYGRPTPDDSFSVIWKPYTAANKEYLKLDDPMTMDSYADRHRIEFWDELYREADLPSMEKNPPTSDVIEVKSTKKNITEDPHTSVKEILNEVSTANPKVTAEDNSSLNGISIVNPRVTVKENSGAESINTEIPLVMVDENSSNEEVAVAVNLTEKPKITFQESTIIQNIRTEDPKITSEGSLIEQSNIGERGIEPEENLNLHSIKDKDVSIGKDDKKDIADTADVDDEKLQFRLLLEEYDKSIKSADFLLQVVLKRLNITNIEDISR